MADAKPITLPLPISSDMYRRSRNRIYRGTGYTFEFAGKSWAIVKHIHEGRADIVALDPVMFGSLDEATRADWLAALCTVRLRDQQAEFVKLGREHGIGVEVMRDSGLGLTYVTSVEGTMIHTTDGSFDRRTGQARPLNRMAFLPIESLERIEARVASTGTTVFVSAELLAEVEAKLQLPPDHGGFDP